MAFSTEWENEYAKGRQFSLYPWSDLVSLVMRFAPPEGLPGRPPKVLEIGCGVGANIPFFLEEGFAYYAVEGSASAVSYVKKRWGKGVDILCADFTEALPYEEGFFDLVVDRSSTPHNRAEGIARVVAGAKKVLKEGCLFIASDWFSVADTEFGKGEKLEEHTFRDIQTGPFAAIGTVHFFSRQELLELFSGWEVLFLEHKLLEGHIPQKGTRTGRWNLVAQKTDLRLRGGR